MELDREELLVAVKAANAVTRPDHAVALFTKVWFVDDHVLAFNNASTVISIPIEVPPLGGVDGRLLAQILDKADDDVIDIEANETGQAVLKAGRSTIKLGLTDPTEFVHKVAKPLTGSDQDGAVLEIDTAMLVEEIELDAMLKLKELKTEASLDFSSLTVRIETGSKLVLFTSDRQTIARTFIKDVEPMDDEAVGRTILIPLEFMRVLKKLWDSFERGTCTIDNKRIVVSGEDGAILHTTLFTVEQPVDFTRSIQGLWPTGKINTKLLVPIPEELVEVLARACAVIKTTEMDMEFSVVDNVLTIAATQKGNAFKETLEFEHPNVRVFTRPILVKDFLKYTDRIYIAPNGLSLFGPNRFSKFIAGTSRTY